MPQLKLSRPFDIKKFTLLQSFNYKFRQLRLLLSDIN